MGNLFKGKAKEGGLQEAAALHAGTPSRDPAIKTTEPTRNTPTTRDNQKGYGGTRLLPEDIKLRQPTTQGSPAGFDTWKRQRRAWLAKRDPKKGKVRWPKVQINVEKKRLGQVSK